MKRFFGRKKRKKPKPVLHSSRPASNPQYQFALKEYLSTVAPGSSNDNGRTFSYEENPMPLDEVPTTEGPMPLAEATARRDQPESTPIVVETVKSDEEDIESVLVQQNQLHHLRQEGMNARRQQQEHIPVSPSITPSLSLQTQSIEEMYSQQQYWEEMGMKRRRVWLEPEMPDATYEEQYGDAYVGAPIKYIYPSGYQSMRPRSGPWKLSIAICALFTWLSVFIVGHCSDRVKDQSQYYYANEIDDDAFAIETRWCGSRPLYFMWVASMLITGLAAAYCSVIGYIKVRDFAVANGRSQPPGMVGQTDYYVRIVDDAGSIAGSVTSASPYQGTIYQADGTPQFWGSHIYRPTQAAVAVTSR